ncbi:MAG: hypothetical protein U0R52_09325 [Solirubrobacterales bacterium]
MRKPGVPKIRRPGVPKIRKPGVPKIRKPGAPAFKRPDIHAPAALSDLVGDLRDRHLLPLVAVLAVAIVAVPIALKQSGGSGKVASPAPSTEPAPLAGDAGGPHVVALEDAGATVRDYRRRLRDLSSKDPFEQQYAQGESAGATGAGSSSAMSGSTSYGSGSTSSSSYGSGSTSYGSPPSSSGASAPVTGSGSGGGDSSGNGNSSGNGQVAVKVETRYASYEIDVRIVAAGSPGSTSSATSARKAARVRRGLPELTMLPSRKTPAAVFMGVSADRKKALLLISSNVRALFGDGKCLVGSSTCQLLALEPGLPETVIFGSRGRAYRIEVLKIRRVVSDHPVRAPLGRNHHGGSHH